MFTFNKHRNLIFMGPFVCGYFSYRMGQDLALIASQAARAKRKQKLYM